MITCERRRVARPRARPRVVWRHSSREEVVFAVATARLRTRLAALVPRAYLCTRGARVIVSSRSRPSVHPSHTSPGAAVRPVRPVRPVRRRNGGNSGETSSARARGATESSATPPARQSARVASRSALSRPGKGSPPIRLKTADESARLAAWRCARIAPEQSGDNRPGEPLAARRRARRDVGRKKNGPGD